MMAGIALFVIHLAIARRIARHNPRPPGGWAQSH